MVNQTLLPAIRMTLRQNEIGNGSPYVLSFAKLGKSGASFGFMQGDTNVNDLARATLRQVLVAANMDGPTVDRIMAALSQPLPNGNPLATQDLASVNQALASDAGHSLVDAMDEQLMSNVLSGLDTCTAAGATRNLGIAPIAYLYIAPWVNMTGPPSTLASWLRGSSQLGLPPPAPPQLTEQAMQTYLQATSYFQQHPKNYQRLLQCIQTGAALLPNG
jgi:hypothetical protein